jgi:hypothetical protein
MNTVTELLTKIRLLPESWHGAGTVPHVVLEKLAALLEARHPSVSLETGTGRTTLLFSHLSANHTVFCVDDRAGGNSYGAVRNSELLYAEHKLRAWSDANYTQELRLHRTD